VAETVVRAGTAADGSELARLRWEWRSNLGRALELSEGDFTERFRYWVEAHPDTHLSFVAENDGSIVGMAWLAVLERVPGPDQWTRLSGILQSVFVAPDHRNGGIGAALVEAVIERARTIGVDYLTVHPSDLSFPLYRRLGFREWDGVLELDIGRPRMPPP